MKTSQDPRHKKRQHIVQQLFSREFQDQHVSPDAQIIIDNKKVDVTPSEAKMYEKIVQSYTTATVNGEDLFVDLFETDDNGIIIFLKPPSKRHTSLEIFLFLISITQHQHLRLMHGQVDDICSQMKEKLKEIDEKLKILSERI